LKIESGKLSNEDTNLKTAALRHADNKPTIESMVI
jgi:hypothetical protein